MTLQEIFTNSRQVIAEEQYWCVDTFAVDVNNSPVNSRGSEACAWCLAGVIQKEAPSAKTKEDCYNIINGLIERDWSNLDTTSRTGLIGEFNDHPDVQHEGVIKLLDSAIELCKEKNL